MPGTRDNLFGTVAVQWGFCSEAEMRECLELQQELAEQGEAVPRLGEILAHKGFMTPDQVRAVLDGQHRQAEGLFGEIAVRWRFCTEEQIQAALDEQTRLKASGEKHCRLGEILHAGGHLKKHQVRAILQAQRKNIAVCNGCGKRFNVSGYEHGAKLRCADCGTVTILRQDARDSSTGKDDDINVDATVFIPKKDLPVREEPRIEIGGYEVYSRLGSDATGTICKARHLESGADVALKIMHSAAMQDPAFLNRFVEEGKVATTLDHTNIKKLYEVGLDQGRYFFSTEYVEGASIRRIIESGRFFTPIQALDVAIQIASALEYAHARGVVHGDLRPSCILITVDGQVKIDGMGIAKDVAANLKKLAATGEMLPLYLAPELAVSPERPGPKSDIYSLGAVIYHMLTGVPPYKGESPLEVLMRVSEETPASIHAINGEVPAYVSGIVHRMLSPEADDRQESAEELLLELRAAHEKMKRDAAEGMHGTPAKAMEPVSTLARGTHEVQPTVKGMAPVTEAVRHRIERREEKSPVAMIVGALIVGVAIAGGAMIYVSPREPIMEGRPRENVEPREPAPAPAADPRMVEAEKRVRKEYEDLVAFRDGNPRDPEAVYRRYKQFLADHESSVVGKTYIQQAVTQAKEYRDKASQKAYEKVRDDSRELVIEKNFAQAIEDARAFLQVYGETEVASSARRLLTTLQESQTEAYRGARQKSENLIARGQIGDARRLLQQVAKGFTEQFADPARKRLAELDAMQATAPEERPAEVPKVDLEAKKRESEAEAQRSLVILKGAVAEQIKIFGFEKAASLAAAAAARHEGTEAGKEMRGIEKDVELVRGSLKSFIDIINEGKAKEVEVKVAGKKLPISSATELVINVRDRSGLSMRVAWHRIDADEVRVLLRSLADKGPVTQNLGLGLLYHYRGEPGWAKVAAARASRGGADTARLEKLIADTEVPAPAEQPKETPAEAAIEKSAQRTHSFTFDDAADLGKFEKVAGAWQAENGAILGRGDPASLQLDCEELVDASGRIRFEKLDCNAQISAGKWSILFQLKDNKAVLSESGPNRKEVDFTAAANTWYDWAIRLERKSAHEVRLGFYINGKEQAAFKVAEPQTGKLWFMVDRNGGIWLDNITVKGLVKTKESVDKESGLKRLQAAGWRVTSGEWSMDADGVINGKAVGAKAAEIEKAIEVPFQLGVQVKGAGQLAGVSFGDKKDFCVTPTDTWQAIALKVQASVDFTIDKTRQWGSGDHTAVLAPGDLGDRVILKTDEKASFKGFDVMSLK